MRTQFISSMALALAASLFCTGVMAQTCLSAPAGLVSWWPGDGNAEDFFDGNSGQARGGVTFSPGVVAEAFTFNGTDGRVFLGNPDKLKLTRSLSIDAWVFVRSFPSPPTATIAQIFFRGDTRGGLDPYYLSVQSSGRVRFHVESTAATENLEAPIRPGAFVHVTATLEDATGLMRIYLDGDVAAETRTSVRPFRELEASAGTGVYIGNLHAPFYEAFDGKIDELAVYDRALAADEVLDIVNAGHAGLCKPKTYVDLAALPDTNGNGVTEIAVLRRLASGSPQVVIKDVSGQAVRKIAFFGGAWAPKAVTSLDADADGTPELSVLAVNEKTGQAVVQIRNALTGELTGSPGFGR